MSFFSKVSDAFSNVKDKVSDGLDWVVDKSVDVGKVALPALAAYGTGNLFGGSSGALSGINKFLGSASGKALGSMASAGLDWYQTGQATEENRRAAEQQMAFQERMSSTAYQRAMADMYQSGLNPMLAYQQGGASTPGGAAYQANVPKPGMQLQEALNMASARQVQASQSRQLDSTAVLNESLGAKARADAARQSAETALIPFRQSEILQNIETSKSHSAQSVASAALAEAQRANTRALEMLNNLEVGKQRVVKAGYQAAAPTVLRATNKFNQYMDSEGGSAIDDFLGKAYWTAREAATRGFEFGENVRKYFTNGR